MTVSTNLIILNDQKNLEILLGGVYVQKEMVWNFFWVKVDSLRQGN